jgi:uncharacterized membrane protein YhaH (DUF805 family)
MDLLFGFKGCIGRARFSILFLMSLIIYSSAALEITQRSFIPMLIRTIIMVSALMCYISCIIRRLHDIGRKSLEILLLAIPAYGLYILFLLFFKKGDLRA